jgi:hypothetical protein
MHLSTKTSPWLAALLLAALLHWTAGGAPPVLAYGGGGGGGDGAGWEPAPSEDAEDAEEPASEGEGEEDLSGFSPKAVDAYKAAGGKAGTGLTLEEWLEAHRQNWEKRQEGLTSDAYWTSWSSSGWNAAYWGAQGANVAGKASQFILNFVPGVGKVVNVGLDTARGAAEGYAEGREKGLSHTESAKVGGKTGVGSGLMSYGFSKFGFGRNTPKQIKKVVNAKTAKQITAGKKALKGALAGTTVDEAVKEGVGSQHAQSLANDAAQPQMP